jgi:hemoglobin
MKKELENRDDIYKLVSDFYVKLLNDDTISHFFEDMINKDGLEEHLQVLVDFWDNMLFYTGVYKRNAMQPHLMLHLRKPFLKHHFKIWLNHFNASIDESFIGETAHAAKTRALSIATIMEIKVNQI